MTRFSYTYTILRYIHDIATGEFVNVGVVLVSPEAQFAGVRLRERPGRLTRMFSDFDKGHFQNVVSHLDNRFRQHFRHATGLPYREFQRDARTVATGILKDDDSAFQWSPLGSGVSSDLQRELDRTYERLVVRHEDTPGRESRSEDEIWKTFRDMLRATRRLPAFSTKTVSTDDDEIEFRHAWKNGKWHCVEPVSFDLQRPRAIQHKAHAWLGGLTSIREAADELRVYFLVASPQREELHSAFERALGILDKAPVEHRIVREGEQDQFLDSITNVLPAPEEQSPGSTQ